MKVLVSACLLGEMCKYNSESNYNQRVIDFLKDDEIISICPEVMGGKGLMGMIMLPAHSPLELCLFACSTMLLAPIAEELFYPKSLILQSSSKALVATSMFSCVLYALNHALMPIGILLISCWAIPFVISYVKTKNIYVSMTTHILLNLIVNGMTIITTLGQSGLK